MKKKISHRGIQVVIVIQILLFPLYQDRFAQVFAIVCIQPTVLYIYIYIY